jgi:hypothetical protein
MRIVLLSNHAGEQLPLAQQKLDTATAEHVDWLDASRRRGRSTHR